MANKLLDLIQSATGACDDKIGGITKMWVGRFSDIATITQTAVVSGGDTTGYNVSAITWSATNGLAQLEFSDNKTAFFNETAGDVGAANELQISAEYEGVTVEKIYALNQLKGECKLVAFVKNRSGVIRLVGVHFPTNSTFAEPTTPLRAKVGSQSGVGNGDYEKMIIELVGQAKLLSYPTTITESALNAMNFS